MVMMMVPVLWILLQQVTLAAPGTPVGDGPVLRRQLRVLKAFIEGLDFMVMAPNNGVIVDRRIRPAPGEPAEARATVQALVEIGTAYAIHVAGGAQAELTLDFPAGAYAAEWVNTKTGEVAKAETFDHAGGRRTLASPAYAEDIVVRVKRTR